MKNEIKENLKEEILKETLENGDSTLATLNNLTGFQGSYDWKLGNVVLWHDISEEAIFSIKELIIEKKIYYKECSPLIYMLDGTYLNLNTSKPNKKNEDYWIPIIFKPFDKLSKEDKYVKELSLLSIKKFKDLVIKGKQKNE